MNHNGRHGGGAIGIDPGLAYTGVARVHRALTGDKPFIAVSAYTIATDKTWPRGRRLASIYQGIWSMAVEEYDQPPLFLEIVPPMRSPNSAVIEVIGVIYAALYAANCYTDVLPMNPSEIKTLYKGRAKNRRAGKMSIRRAVEEQVDIAALGELDSHAIDAIAIALAGMKRANMNGL